LANAPLAGQLPVCCMEIAIISALEDT